MIIDTSEKWLPIYEALASPVRLRIIQLLAENTLNIKELAEELHLSSAIISMHVKKLETANIIKCERTHTKGAVQKLCSLYLESLEIEFPSKTKVTRKKYEFSIPIGHYTDFQITPTCGLATSDKIIGYFDDPRYFWDAERVNAKILWFTQGFVEYKIPNHLLSDEEPSELEISLELGSEAPGINNNWPSDITFYFNGIKLGYWTSPGDFGMERGKYTPAWWSTGVGQYGLMKVLKVDHNGTYMDGLKISDVKLEQLDIQQKYWDFKIEVSENAEHMGGVTIFGSGFGNYNQDILLKLYYHQKNSGV